MLFGETQSAIIVSIAESDLMKVKGIGAEHGVTCEALGRVTGRNLKINSLIDIPVTELKSEYESAIPKLMERSLI